MELERVKEKSKCDTPNCKNDATYILKFRRFWNIGNTKLCKNCLNDLHETISRELVPLSPKNILKEPKKFKKED
ncbi:MAG: hypothetical protein AB7S44_00580 [Spirochaetales bacterium]